MKKNQNGVTLIALAVTIIVMLILAGVTMATLTGDTGIITQSRRTAAASTEGTVKENMSAAFTSVSMEVQTERAVSAAYSAEDHISEYLKIAADQIGKDAVTDSSTTFTDGKSIDDLASNKGKYTIYVVKKDSKSYIYIDYIDNTFCLTANTTSATKTKATNKNEYPMLRAKILFETNSVSLDGPYTNAI